ncbi:hypothetical protein RRU94_03280 [Domibacillus sp. DTU_2020_1001157_1_SI_ALB_TIR_016]|uniref:hypothetical protein n=1 Tax=Domibacillus sp. DTU_2020_1001157_1_SI_ALB_TIR_016 TaxID=3077789 RepID=UPI0028E2DF12|nr:hypothetical protein [Domibacillus sp. DTU_2020_1001157_1_SI_ALB_TIR_016]WNS78976.1 hypothetical protein RRU94_03280 [Domibacillus sp. DTU_2020_1001157_1_SI_ALB_TIR_016]
MDPFEKLLSDFNQLIIEERNSMNVEIDTEKMDSFKKTIDELQHVKNKFKDKHSCLQDTAVKDIIRFEYAKGGESIHRGYYCPNLVYDLVVGNAKRGRLYKRKPQPGKFTYEYGFDREGRLLRVRKTTEFTASTGQFNEEFLLYEEDAVYSVCFHHTSNLEVVSKCIYDSGKVTRYERSLFLLQHAELYSEEYSYENGMPSHVSIFNVMPSIHLYEEQKYMIKCSDEGEIKKLTGGSVNNGVWDQQSYRF